MYPSPDDDDDDDTARAAHAVRLKRPFLSSVPVFILVVAPLLNPLAVRAIACEHPSRTVSMRCIAVGVLIAQTREESRPST